MILQDVREELATRLNTTELRAYAWVKGPVTPPTALVMLPQEITYDATYARGSDRLTLDVLVVVGKAADRSAFETISGYADGSGSGSIKALLDGDDYTHCDSVRVTQATFDVVSIAAVDYLSATFTLDIIGSGS